jgi:ATP-dependent DNA helicase 2 subunit 2
MTKTNIIVNKRDDDKQALAFNSLVRALVESESYAVARFVQKDEKAPMLLLLAPCIEPDYECLMDVELPFAEDMRNFKFPPLDRVVLIGGKTVHQHRNLPKDDLKTAMSKLVDSMDLSNVGDEEYAQMKQAYSPVVHRITQAIRFRAIHPASELPDTPEILTRYSQPPKELLSKCDADLKALVAAADVKRVPPRQKGRKRDRDTVKPLSGLDIDALLNTGAKRVKLSKENAIPEFKQLLGTADNMDAIRNGVDQLSSIIEDFIRQSTGDRNYGRAVEAIGVMREELIEMEEPEMFNDFIKKLKKGLAAEEYGTGRKDMWWLIKSKRLGLIDHKTSEISEVTEDEAAAVSWYAVSVCKC